jgi:small subunit ribosomal protein S16
MRGGRKKRPFYRLVAASALAPRDGRFLEKVGTYNPLGKDGAEITLKTDRVMYWLQQGAQPTKTAKNIFSAEGLMLKLDLLKRGVSEEEADKKIEEFKAERAKRQEEKAAKSAEKAKAKAEAAKKEAEEVEETDAAEETAE